MTPWVLRLLLANAVMYFLTLMRVPMNALVLVPNQVLSHPWTPITYMFLHANLMHIFFNMLVLFIFGPRVEMRLGSRQFLGLYFTSGLMGAALSIFTPGVGIIGASGAVFGVQLAFAYYWPRERIYIWGVLPIEAWFLVLILTVMALGGAMGFGGGGIAHFAHLGGFLGGFLYLKWWEHRSPAARFRAKARPVAARRRGGGSASDVRRWGEIKREDMHPVNREELDRVLDKISAKGISSLTDDERAFLERFSAK